MLEKFENVVTSWDELTESAAEEELTNEELQRIWGGLSVGTQILVNGEFVDISDFIKASVSL